jgi:hypothetical protein
MRRAWLGIIVALAGCGGRAAVGGDASRPATDAASAPDARDTPGAIRSLAITLPDGRPVPLVIAHGTRIEVTVIDAVTSQPVPEATWTATGVCTIDGPPGATHVINFGGFGACTLTAASAGVEAKVTFSNVVVDQVKIDGDTSPLRIGETRTFTVSATGPARRAGRLRDRARPLGSEGRARRLVPLPQRAPAARREVARRGGRRAKG